MSTTKLEGIVTDLETELEELDAKIGATKLDLQRYSDNKKKVLKALQLLGANSTSPPCPTGKLVTPIVERLLRTNDGLNETELYDLVRDELSDEGYGASGLKLRVNEALDKIEGVETSPEGLYRLSGDLTAAGVG